MTEFFDSVSFFFHLLAGTVYCFGVYKIFQDILTGPATWMELKIGSKWCKPLFLCPPCMASFHGFYLGVIFFGFDWTILLYCICLCGANYIVNSLLPEYE